MDMKYRSNLFEMLPQDAFIAELGCAEGYFSADILRWPNTKQLYMVDAWETLTNQTGDGTNPMSWHSKNYSDAMARVSFAKDRVKVLRGITWEQAKNVPDGSLDLLYLDACHAYSCVYKDLTTWLPKVKAGGIVAGHDYLNKSYGVFDAVRDFTNGKYKVETIPENKDEDAGFYFINK